MFPAATTSAMRRTGRSTLSDRLRAVVPGVYDGGRDDYGEPTGPLPDALVMFDERCKVVEDRLTIERAASGDEALASADAALRIDKAKGLLGAQDEDALTLHVEHGPTRERVTRPARLEGMRHTRTGVYAFIRWTGPSKPMVEAAE